MEQEICYLQLKTTKGPGELSRKLLISPEEKEKSNNNKLFQVNWYFLILCLPAL